MLAGKDQKSEISVIPLVGMCSSPKENLNSLGRGFSFA